MTRELPDEVLDLLDYQAGALSRSQAKHAGMTGKQIDTAARSGRWQRLHAGVYAAFSGEPGRVTVLWAAVLRAGPKAVLSHHSAAELQGLAARPAPAIHVMVPAGRQIAPIRGVVLHYSSLVTRERHPALRPPQTRVEETVLDLAGGAASLDEALGWIFRACGSRRTTAERIASALARRARMRWRTELTAALGLGADGVHSLLEFRYVNRVERPHELPVATRQVRVTRAGHGAPDLEPGAARRVPDHLHVSPAQARRCAKRFSHCFLRREGGRERLRPSAAFALGEQPGRQRRGTPDGPLKAPDVHHVHPDADDHPPSLPCDRAGRGRERRVVRAGPNRRDRSGAAARPSRA